MLDFVIRRSALLLVLMPMVAMGHDDHPDQTRDEDRFMTTRPVHQVLPLTDEEDVFHFLIYGDRTGGVPEGLKVLDQAVTDTNLLDPDLVMTVGDLIQGYNDSPRWLPQMKRYKKIMGRLSMPWYPVAGNHDIYWRGQGQTPEGHHEANYEKHFGPLWYSFRHKNAAFVVLYSDEGDQESNEKGFSQGRLQKMSDAQLEFLKKSLHQHRNADHVFVFLHHPRWIVPRYEGSNWNLVHEQLKEAGNVSAVFAGHIHHMHYGGKKDGIEYHTLATTGGHLGADIPGAGYLHHMNMVSVRKSGISVSAIPVGAVMDPKEFTDAFAKQIEVAQSIRPIIDGEKLALNFDGSVQSEISFRFENPCDHAVNIHVDVDSSPSWTITPDHVHTKLGPGRHRNFKMHLKRDARDLETLSIPHLVTTLEFLGEKSRVTLPPASTQFPLKMNSVPSDYFKESVNQCLQVRGPESVAGVHSEELNLPEGPFTLETWLRPQQNAGFLAAIAKTERSGFAIFVDEGVPQFDLNLDGRYVTAKAKDVLPIDQWTHVAGVFDGSHVKIFVNGQQVGTAPGSGMRRRNDLPLFIGGDPDRRGEPTRNFIGDIDEVRITRGEVYKDSFTPSRRLSVTKDTVLMLHWDRQVGPFVLDESSQASKATLGDQGKLVPVGSSN